MMNTASSLTIDDIRTLLSPIFQSHEVKKTVLFGSRARGDNGPDSDIDLHVLFMDDGALTLSNIHELTQEASIATGLAIDLIPIQDLKREAPLLFHQILNDGVVIYERKAE